MRNPVPCPSVSRVSTGASVWEGRKHHQLWGRPATPTPGPWAAAKRLCTEDLEDTSGDAGSKVKSALVGQERPGAAS